ncbi:TadE/TadG family type IV pilus assembly protein [Streptomyces hoynatensis]|uniref:Pilus assembly protein n=1 Tax=Streptomyces hoynatensis TaxID=1141874 RepID=A0A3A9ZF17_9ACTN|nr:TadE/TadG family type IV pilus assembly protein [Streptomyces hoynatensis]RKN46981.1 pilus assembly protein [Streptomyces hoynatensis]
MRGRAAPGTAPAPAPARRRPRGDRGAVTAVEFAGWVPILLIVALAALQLGVAGYAALQAGSAARAAARTAAQHEIAEEYAASGRAAMSGWLAERASFDLSACGREATVTASVPVPSVLPFIGNLGSAHRTVTMPCD